MSHAPVYRTAVVTGASSGIGRSLARGLCQQGTRVILIARTESALLETAAELASTAPRGTPPPKVVVLDVAQTQHTVEVLRALSREHPDIDLVIANAGVGATPSADAAAPRAAHDWETIASALHTNLCGAAATLTALLPDLVARRRGHLVGISSLASFAALPGSAAYCAPKAGLSMLLDCLHLDLLPHNIAVTSVHVGFVQTPMVARSTHPMPFLLSAEQSAAHILARLPLRPRRIDFPWPMVWLTRLLAALPHPLRALLARHHLKNH